MATVEGPRVHEANGTPSSNEPTKRSPSFPPFYPIVRKGCEEASSLYFNCVEQHTRPGTMGAEVAVKCAQVRQVYEGCFSKSHSSPPAPAVLVNWEPLEATDP
eukprot:GHVS01046090.1.p1 GENE.GHVS01046090.1~~GHVS01046090.1.p1  ORF type:complete len:103 (+),score=14.46 GHVS01046090.1:194-502(+)